MNVKICFAIVFYFLLGWYAGDLFKFLKRKYREKKGQKRKGAMGKKPATTISRCKNCGNKYDRKEVQRVFGEYSSTFIAGCCSAYCYTLYTISAGKKEGK